ncbi:MAG: helix-turn-helix domain-containing protein [Phycisphaerales bacterium]|nr:helix-turn-helix domain-containing protein [Phycisphaerales bacterium]
MLAPPTHLRLDARRRELGLSFHALSVRTRVSVPTLKRMLGRGVESASFASVDAVARALGAPLALQESDAYEMVKARATELAERTARLVQGTSALESQAVDPAAYRRLVERTYHQLLAGSRRRLWSE